MQSLPPGYHALILGASGAIGGAIAALLSDDCRWLTAQRIEASGGMFI